MRDTLPDEAPAAADPVEQFRLLWQAGGRPDVAAFLAGAGGLPPDAVVDVLRLDQQERWRRGDEVPAEWYLDQFPQVAADPDGAFVLVYGEVLARTERGERPALTDFVLRFPQFAEFLSLQWEVHDALENAKHSSTLTFEGPPPAPTAPVGPAVPGYEVEEEVGRGAVGVVYRARQAAINRPCALKVVMEGQLARPDKLIRFLEEARVIARLKHPNIVGIYDLGTHETGPFMALEWVGGGTLADRVAAGPLDPAEAARLAATLARAAGYAHEKGVIHRDLKPANVLMTEAGEPKIADFGLAKHLHAANPGGTALPGQPVGTPTYMAPEQTGGKGEVTPAADVYSLGAVLYELLTGRVPLAGASIEDTLRLVAGQEPVPPRELNAKVPRDLETVCLKCLEKDPKKRYPDGHALADDLGRFLAGEPIAARPIGPAGRAVRWLARHPRWAVAAALAAALTLTAAAGLVGGLVRLAEERRRAELAEQAAVARLTEEQKAKAETREQRWQGLVSEARAVRRGGRAGQRTEALAKLKEARAVLAGPAADARPAAGDLAVIRDEAIACLALPDVESADGPIPPLVFDRGRGEGMPASARMSRDGRLGVSADPADAIRVWDVPAGRPILSVPGRLIDGGPFGSDDPALEFDFDGRPVRLRIILPAGYRVLAREATGPPPDRLVSPDGKTAAVGSGYGLIDLRDAGTGKVLARLEAPEPTRLRPAKFDRDGTVLEAVGVESRAVHVWDLGVIRAELKALDLDWDGP